MTATKATPARATPEQTAGPFYPGPLNTALNTPNPLYAEPSGDTDLTQVNGRQAQGRIVQVQGTVRDAYGRPLRGATVEIWQACVTGRYNDEKDTNPAPIDPGFKYWGWTLTDRQGRYLFKTIVPGIYPAEIGWARPPHIHFKAMKVGFQEVITQMYFLGEALNDRDHILLALAGEERARLIVDFRSSIGTFDLTLLCRA